MVAAMARLFYTEMFLTAMVTLNLVALYRCRAFAGRGWSVVWGLSLGVGLLVKWTMPVYVALPLIWVLWQDGFFACAGPTRCAIRVGGSASIGAERRRPRRRYRRQRALVLAQS